MREQGKPTNSINIGPLTINFHKTIRVKDSGKEYDLPPSLGYFNVYKVSDFMDRGTCPSSWDKDGYFIAIHPKEALWMSFRSSKQVAFLVGAGCVNAINGEKLTVSLKEGNYIVAPTQPWLDGWKNEDGTVCQFVGTEYKGGEGLTVGEQILGEESKTGGIGIAVFESKEPLQGVQSPYEYSSDGVGGAPVTCDSSPYGQHFSLCSTQHQNKVLRSRGMTAAEMGVGKGGKIKQKIYKDPYGLQVWKESPTATAAVYLVDAESFSLITGLPCPPLPKAVEEYYGKWFGLHDKHMADQTGSAKFVELKSAVNDKSNVFVEDPAKKNV